MNGHELNGHRLDFEKDLMKRIGEMVIPAEEIWKQAQEELDTASDMYKAMGDDVCPGS